MSTKRRKVVSDMLRNYELERIYSPEAQIKSEPRDRTPPHHNISSPPLHAYAPQYEQNWGGLENMGGLGAPGPSHVNPVAAGHGNPFVVQEMWQNQPYGQVSPVHLQTQNLQVLPNMPGMASNMQALSPNVQPMSPNMQPLSPNMAPQYGAAERMSPNVNMSVLSPHAQSLSPAMHGAAPMGRVSPNMQPNMGHISPNLVQHQQPVYTQQQQQQQQQQQNLMETEGHSAASLTNLLLDRGNDSLLLNSSELSGLSALLGERSHEPQPLDY